MSHSNILISGGNILTGDQEYPEAQAVLISGNIITAVGSYPEIMERPEAADPLRIDLEGNTVLPGLTDSHLHLASVAKQMEALSLKGASSLQEMLAMIKEKAWQVKRDEWIYGVGFDDSSWPEQRLPTRQDLDRLVPYNPVIITRTCAHIHVANSPALNMCGLSPETDVLYEDQASPVIRKMFEHKFSPLRMKDILYRTCLTLASQGITCAHTCGCSSYGLGEDMDIYRELREKNRLPLRIIYYSDETPSPGLESGHGDDWLRYGGYKLFLDGSLGGRTAALTLPYEDQPENRGILNHSTEEVRQIMKEMHSRNIQTLVHAIGDAAVDQFIEGLRYASPHGPEPGNTLRHRIVHLQICRPEQIRTLGELGAICDIQPSFVPSDIGIASERLGRSREPWAYAWKDMIRAGLVVTGSSDAPVESTDPFRGIWAALNRTDDMGNPRGGWRPDQKLTLHEALPLFTSNPWKAVGLSSRFGMVKAGFPADLVILDRDIRKMPLQSFREVKPVLTMVNGIISFGELEGWPSFL